METLAAVATSASEQLAEPKSPLFKEELLADPELCERVERLYASDFDCFGFQRKHAPAERPGLPGDGSADFNFKHSPCSNHPKAFEGLVDAGAATPG